MTQASRRYFLLLACCGRTCNMHDKLESVVKRQRLPFYPSEVVLEGSSALFFAVIEK